jgi:hypothetical protein
MAGGDEAGWSVDVSDGSVIVGAHLADTPAVDGGAAYVYVPDPATLVLLGFGALGLARRRRRGQLA